MNKITQLRAMAIALLDDPNGISEAAYTNLQALEATIANGSCNDIFLQVEAAEGRFFLSEDHDLVAEVSPEVVGETQ